MSEVEQTPAEGQEEVVRKTTIRPNLANYLRDKSGNGKRTQRTDDFVARSLAGKTVEEVLAGGEKLGIDVAKWSHLNPGQQRMLVGNKIRHLMAVTKDPLTAESVTAVFGEPVAEYDEEAAKAAAEAAAAAKAAAAEGGEGEAPVKTKRNAKKATKAPVEGAE